MAFNYTPRSIADIVFGSQHSKNTIDLITSGRIEFPFTGKNGILLYGTWGTGKTTLANLLPDAIEAYKTGQQAQVTYLGVSSGNNGAALVSRIANICQVLHMTGSHQYFVLDEVDNLLKDAMQSLRTVMNDDNAVFILTTNHLSKIERGVQDRCHLVEFNAAPPDAWLPLFKRILVDEQCPVPPDDKLLPLIAPHCGSARNIITEAQRLAASTKASSPRSAAPATQTGNALPAASPATSTAGASP